MELSLRFAARDGQQAMRLIEHLQKHHLEEPGVGEALTQMLMDVGLLRPDGTPAFAPGGRRAGDGRGRGAGGRARRTLDARQRQARQRRRKTLDAGIGKRSAFSSHLSAIGFQAAGRELVNRFADFQFCGGRVATISPNTSVRTWGLGMLAMLAGTALLLAGFAYYAKAKGRHPAWCLMAFLSIIGLIVLLPEGRVPIGRVRRSPAR